MDGTLSSPLVAFTSLGMGLLILYISIFTLTISHWSLPFIRLGLAPVAIVSFWRFGFGNYEGPTQASPSGMTTIALYGIMRVLEHSVVTLWYPSTPHWVVRAQFADGSRTITPLPRTFRTRCVYALDLLTTMRGLSWFGNLEWSWISRSLPPRPQGSPRDFLLFNIMSFSVQYLIMDFCDILIQSHPWDSGNSYPMTELPIFYQVAFPIPVIIEICLALTLPYTLVSSICVLCGSSPSVWPPLVDSPFFAKSLREFWSRRWHFMFRHTFDRLSQPLMQVVIWLSGGKIRAHGHVGNILRTYLTFLYSTLLHLFIQHRLASLENNRTGRMDKPTFLDGSIIAFFLSQPLGLIVESTVLEPLLDWKFPARTGSHTKRAQKGSGGTDETYHDPTKTTPAISRGGGIHPPGRWQKDTVTRLYVWVFLIWTGRWWSDAWARAGVLNPGIKVVPISPLRGLWEGRWVM